MLRINFLQQLCEKLFESKEEQIYKAETFEYVHPTMTAGQAYPELNSFNLSFL